MKRGILLCKSRRRRRSRVVWWADLPQELLSKISGDLDDTADILRFRSVCRSWRLSIPPLFYKISPFFPVVFPLKSLSPFDSFPLSPSEKYVYASAVYLLRPRRDPSKAWMVYAQEVSPGNLVFRHAVTLKKLPAQNWPDLSSDEWSSVTRIARSNNYFSPCTRCHGFGWLMKFAILYNPGSESNLLIRLGSMINTVVQLFAYVRGPESSTITVVEAPSLCNIEDFVHYKGFLYAAGKGYSLLRLDQRKPEMIHLIAADTIDRRRSLSCERLVEWDGDLYFIVVYPDDTPPECYILAEREKRCRWERVEDLRDGVVFITKDCAFSMSARDLPPPWRGNTIVCFRGLRVMCLCLKWKVEVFELGVEGAKFTPILSSDGVVPFSSSFHGYSDLFAPPL